jgi:Txe/YoeB family toxin of Txe-Axe toxin-antitoxin module
MDIICNELSYYPLAENDNEAERRFKLLINTFREAKGIWGFRNIRFHSDFPTQMITDDKNFYNWISGLSNSVLKNIILSYFKKPFADDLNEEELNSFFESEYSVYEENMPVNHSPIGFPIAHIKSVPTISFDSHNIWNKCKFRILKTNTSETENLDFDVYNICLHSSLKSDEINEWTENIFANSIDSEEMLLKFLSYSKYGITFNDKFLIQLFELKESSIDLFKYTLLLMKDVQIHPFTGGMGQTENLKYKGKEASKRITFEDRLSYKIENDVVTFIACKGHYEFH